MAGDGGGTKRSRGGSSGSNPGRNPGGGGTSSSGKGKMPSTCPTTLSGQGRSPARGPGSDRRVHYPGASPHRAPPGPSDRQGCAGVQAGAGREPQAARESMPGLLPNTPGRAPGGLSRDGTVWLLASISGPLNSTARWNSGKLDSQRPRRSCQITHFTPLDGELQLLEFTAPQRTQRTSKAKVTWPKGTLLT